MFYADVRRVGETGDFYGTLNSDHMGHDRDAQVLKAKIDAEIVQRVRMMLEPYKLVRSRVKDGS